MKFHIGRVLGGALLFQGHGDGISGNYRHGRTAANNVYGATIDNYPNCHVVFPTHIGNGVCDDKYNENLYHGYNTEECGWDGGDCLTLKAVDGFPDCRVVKPERIGDGYCDEFRSDGTPYPYNTLECGWDGGDCPEHPDWPGCHVRDIEWIGNGSCQAFDNYNTAECGYDGGDCLDFNEKYPNCKVFYAEVIGDGQCIYDVSDVPYEGFNDWDEPNRYYTEECGWDGGDCATPAAFPDCHLHGPELSYKIGDGVCNMGQFNTLQCGWDGGDCIKHNKLHPPPGWPGDGGIFSSPGDNDTCSKPRQCQSSFCMVPHMECGASCKKKVKRCRRSGCPCMMDTCERFCQRADDVCSRYGLTDIECDTQKARCQC